MACALFGTGCTAEYDTEVMNFYRNIQLSV